MPSFLSAKVDYTGHASAGETKNNRDQYDNRNERQSPNPKQAFTPVGFRLLPPLFL
jgi:hypothetical protein